MTPYREKTGHISKILDTSRQFSTGNKSVVDDLMRNPVSKQLQINECDRKRKNYLEISLFLEMNTSTNTDTVMKLAQA